MGSMGRTPSTAMQAGSAILAVTLASATDTDSAAIDTRGYEWATFFVNIGTLTGTDCTVTTKIMEDSDTNISGASDVTGATTVAVTAANDNAQYQIEVDLTGRSRYLFVRATTENTVTTCPIAVSYILSGANDSRLVTASYTRA